MSEVEEQLLTLIRNMPPDVHYPSTDKSAGVVVPDNFDRLPANNEWPYEVGVSIPEGFADLWPELSLEARMVAVVFMKNRSIEDEEDFLATHRDEDMEDPLAARWNSTWGYRR